MSDPYPGILPPLSGPYGNAAAITPDDTNPLPTSITALWIGTAGTLTFVPRNSTTPITLTVAATTDNKPLRLYIKKILATGTTAGSLVGFW